MRFAVLAGVPSANSEAVLAALKDQCPHADPPIFLRVQSHPNAVASQCYAAVQSFLNELPPGSNARPVFGWLVWEQKDVFINFEHHVVAEVDGTLIDVATHVGGERVILFAPDPTASVPFDDPGTNPLIGSNRYYGLSDSEIVKRIVTLKRRNDEVARALLHKGRTQEQVWNTWEWKNNDDEVYNLFLLLEKRKRDKKQKDKKKRR